MVETDRQIDLCSEHAQTPGFSSGLVVVQEPDCGHRIRRSMVEIPSHRSTECRGGESSADAKLTVAAVTSHPGRRQSR